MLARGLLSPLGRFVRAQSGRTPPYRVGVAACYHVGDQPGTAGSGLAERADWVISTSWTTVALLASSRGSPCSTPSTILLAAGSLGSPARRDRDRNVLGDAVNAGRGVTGLSRPSAS